MKIPFSLRARIVAGCGLLVAILIAVVIGTPILGVSHVEVEGARMLTSEQIRGAAKISGGTPLVRLDTGAVGQRIGAIPEVARAEVFRMWPRGVRILVMERVAVAVARSSGGFTLVDEDGIGFREVPDWDAVIAHVEAYGSGYTSNGEGDPENASPPTALPLIEVPELSPDDAATSAVLRVVADLPPELFADLEKVVASSATDVHLRLDGGRIVFWGDPSDTVRKARVALAVLPHGGKYIDVSAPDVVTVR